MTRSKRLWRQAELAVSPGAEPWVIVRHRRGWFRVPMDAPVSEVLTGIEEGWSGARKSKGAGGCVRVSIRQWEDARTDALAWRAHLAAGGD